MADHSSESKDRNGSESDVDGKSPLQAGQESNVDTEPSQHGQQVMYFFCVCVCVWCVDGRTVIVLQGGKQLFGTHTHFQREYNDRL